MRRRPVLALPALPVLPATLAILAGTGATSDVSASEGPEAHQISRGL